MEGLVVAAVSEATADLRRAGHRGRLAVVKGSVDAVANPIGVHENYLVEDPLHPLAAPVAAVAVLVFALAFGVVAALVVALLLVVLVVLFPGVLVAVLLRSRRLRSFLARAVDRALVPALDATARFLLFLWAEAVSAVARALVFRRFQRDLPSFLATRSIFAGTGHLHFGPPGRPPAPGAPAAFALSARPFAFRRTFAVYGTPGIRPAVDLKTIVRDPFSVFERRRRLHVLMGDANASEYATALKLATTCLVLDAIEGGADLSRLRLKDPLEAARAVALDPTLARGLALAAGGEATALEVQRGYHEAVRAHLESRDAAAGGRGIPAAAATWLERWASVLEALAENPRFLYRELDWVAKLDIIDQALREHPRRPRLETVDAASPLAAALRKVDLRYAELGPEGYRGTLAEASLAARLFDEASLARARTAPPAGTRAKVRAALVRAFAGSGRSARISWDACKLRSPRETLRFRDPLVD
jgi:hypothetical protein